MKTRLDLDIHQSIPPHFSEEKWVSFDSEFFGMEKKRLHRPHGKFACITVCADGKTVFISQDEKDISTFLMSAEKAERLVLQSALFDIRQLRRYAKFLPTDKLWDTKLIERILWGGLFDNFDLKAMARRYFQFYLEKEIREEFETATEMNDERIYYAALDCAMTWHIAQKQRKFVTKADPREWQEIDLPTVWAIADMPGFMVDRKRWEEVGIANEEKANNEKEHFPFNPDSPAQVKKYLIETEKLQIKSTNADELEPLHNPMGDRVLAYRKVKKQASTYGLSWLRDYVEADDRVYTDYDPSMAETSRMSSSRPNIQNIPIRETPIFRECFIAADENILVVGDLEQQEPRTAAYLSQDENMIRMFLYRQDIYCEIGKKIYGEKIEKDDSRRKLILKPSILGIIYGMTPFGLARDTGISEDEATEIIDSIFRMFPQLAHWIWKQQRCGDYVTTALGRKLWLNKYNIQWMRNCRNSPIQGTAAEIIKRGVSYLHETWPPSFGKFGLVAIIHDEIILEVSRPIEMDAKRLLEDCLIAAGEDITPGVPAVVEISTGKNWACKH